MRRAPRTPAWPRFSPIWRENLGHGRAPVRDHPRWASVGARARAAGLVLTATALLGAGLAGCGGGGSSIAASSTASTMPPGRAEGGSTSVRATPQVVPDRIERLLKAPKTSAQQVRGVVKALLTIGGAGTCGPPVVTPRYVRAAYGSRPGCIKATQSHADVAHGLEFRRVRMTGSSATAVVIPSGGLYDGEQLTVSLVRKPRWAVDALRSNAPVGP